MRVAIVSPNPLNDSGGVERFCHTLRGVLADQGAQAEVVGLRDLGLLNYDLAITNGMIGRPVDRPRIHVFHGCWVEHVRRGYRGSDTSLQWRTRFLAQGAAKEIRAGRRAYRVAVSQRTAQEVTRWYRFPVHQVINNGVDTRTFAVGDRRAARLALGIPGEAKLALFVGRPEVRKRPDVAAAAAAGAGYELLLAGSGSIDGARGLGVLTPDVLSLWIQAVDCVLAPSEYEGCSLAILEAFAVGTPVVASRVGWIPTLLDNVPEYRELTAPAGDIGLFTAALKALPDRLDAAATASAFVRRENSLDAFARHWAGAVGKVLSHRE